MDIVTEVFNDLYKLIWPGTVLLCLWCYFITLGLRRVAERVAPSLQANWWWNEVVLYFTPMILGALSAFPVRTLLPAILTKASAVFIWGAVSGALSSFVYNRARAILNKKFQDAGVDIVLPPPPAEKP
jgi:hypothetical protein